MYIAVLDLGSVGLLEGLEGFFREDGAVGARGDGLGRGVAAVAAAGGQGFVGLRVREVEGEEEEVGVWLVCGHGWGLSRSDEVVGDGEMRFSLDNVLVSFVVCWMFGF